MAYKTKISRMPSGKSTNEKPSWAAELGSFPHDAVWQRFHLGERVPSPSDWSQRSVSWRPVAHACGPESSGWFWHLTQDVPKAGADSTQPEFAACRFCRNASLAYQQSWWRDGDFDLQVFLSYLLLIWNKLNMRNLRTGPHGSTFFKSHAFIEHVLRADWLGH